MNELLRRLKEDGAEIVTMNRGKIKIQSNN